MFAHAQYDALIVNPVLQDVSANELARLVRLREDPQHRISLVALSSGPVPDSGSLRAAAFDALLVKPLDENALSKLE